MTRRERFWSVFSAAMVAALCGALPAVPQVLQVSERFGEGALVRLLRSSDTGERTRGLERLSLPFRPEVRERLLTEIAKVESLSLAEKRVLVFALARFAEEPSVATLLYRLLSDSSDPDVRLSSQVQTSAALALSRARTPRALAFLVTALEHPGPLAEVARVALLAHPPADVRALCSSTSPVLAVALVGELGDARALPALRTLVQTAPMAVSVQAAVAMAKLGNSEPLGLARAWAESSAPKLRSAAAQILVALAQADVGPGIAGLLAEEETIDLGVQLAHQARPPRLVNALARVLKTAVPLRAEKVRRVLAAIESDAAGLALVRASRNHSELALAAHALASSLSAAAARTIAAKLAHAVGWERRLWARATLVQQSQVSGVVSDLEPLIAELARSQAAPEQALVAWMRAGLDPELASRWLRSSDSRQVWAATSGVREGADCARAAARIELEKTPNVRVGLTRCLLYPRTWEQVSTGTLLELLENGVTAPMAALLLGARFEADHTRSLQLLSSADADVRAAALLGLSTSAWSERFAFLKRAYAAETEPEVRRAIVIGMGLNRRSWFSAWLLEVAALDADAGVRRAAELGSAGKLVWPAPSGTLPVWVFVEAPRGGITSAVGIRVGPGLVLPALPDPDGFVVFPQAVSSGYGLRLALAAEFREVREAHEQAR